mmetsp:Transcript_32294/g.38010  ORF Transcript_32294/g.38010 Transcript_32294/m.38010 type:complete len:105 (-) Transcript_32294:597-911(-)
MNGCLSTCELVRRDGGCTRSICRIRSFSSGFRHWNCGACVRRACIFCSGYFIWQMMSICDSPSKGRKPHESVNSITPAAHTSMLLHISLIRGRVKLHENSSGDM